MEKNAQVSLRYKDLNWTGKVKSAFWYLLLSPQLFQLRELKLLFWECRIIAILQTTTKHNPMKHSHEQHEHDYVKMNAPNPMKYYHEASSCTVCGCKHVSPWKPGRKGYTLITWPFQATYARDTYL